jgi:hypothetical protein
MSGSILLGNVAARTPEIEVACRACPRRGVLRTDKLLVEHGRAMTMPTLLQLLAGDCPKAASLNLYERCDVHSPTLSTLFAA